MSSNEGTNAESGVWGSKGPDKSLAGDDMPRGPPSIVSDGGRERGARRTRGDHVVITKAQVHAVNDDTDIDDIPASKGTRGMHTRSKTRIAAETIDSSNPTRSRRDLFREIAVEHDCVCQKYID